MRIRPSGSPQSSSPLSPPKARRSTEMRGSLAAAAVLALAGGAVRAEPDHAMGMTAGIAVAAPDSNARRDGYGFGAMLMAEYVKSPGNWFSPRLYTGLVLASPQP